jgi:hypothetical protein
MTCCLEFALLTALRGIAGTPIASRNHFNLVRECEDCVPYLVMKIVDSPGLRTTSGTQTVSTVELNAYFNADRKDLAYDYKSLISSWLNSSGCIDLGECGCFCVRNSGTARVAVATGGMVRYSVSFSGTYQSIAVGSGSLSESV